MAVVLTSSQNHSPTNVKLYQAALSEIAKVVASVCKIHRLPLALIWAPCHQQGKDRCCHSDESCNYCVSTVGSACIVSDPETTGFYVACSEHHLWRGQGIVGAAFATNKPCFAANVAALGETEHPLSELARTFGLRAAMAVPLCSGVYTGMPSFMVELFLPKGCIDPEQQKQWINSLLTEIQLSCKTLHAAVGKEVEEKQEEKVALPARERLDVWSEVCKPGSSLIIEPSAKDSLRAVHMMEEQRRERGLSASLDHQTGEPEEELRVTTHGVHQCCGAKGSVGRGESYSSVGHQKSGVRKTGEKRRTKREETINLAVLQQYFAGSLKDAAKSIGVCPTTLKRICRRYGITRWPSRKIKKVGHSLRKLQLMIDSVQGAKGPIQIGSLCSSFQDLSSPQKHQGINESHLSPISQSDIPNRPHSRHLCDFVNNDFSKKSQLSSRCQGQSPSVCLTSTLSAFYGDALVTMKDPSKMPRRACSEEESLSSNKDRASLTQIYGSYRDDQNQNPDTLPLSDSSERNSSDGFAFRIKANYGDNKIRFRVPPECSFQDLQAEIAKRFNLDDLSRIDIKYLDDEREWVLLTCNADLQESFELHQQSQNHTMRLCLQQASQLNEEGPLASK